MTQLQVVSTRSGVVESTHRVSVAIVKADGQLYASSGDPDLVTFTRSTAKPFQALPLVLDGAVERFDITAAELALACASHNSEKTQVEIVKSFLHRLGLSEADLACGPHTALGSTFAVPPLSADMLESPSPLSSNCSGKHTGMLAQALNRNWETNGYEKSGHPVQQRIMQEMSRWTGMSAAEIGEGVDGCTAVSFALPLSRLATALVCLVRSEGAAERILVSAMTGHPHLVAGENRLGTELMRAYPGEIVVKVGAEGVYIAALASRGLGVALKVEDGHSKAAMVALVHVLDQLGWGCDPPPSELVPKFATFPVLNTRDEPVGELRAIGELTFV
jgi:L-asparaginase II